MEKIKLKPCPFCGGEAEILMDIYPVTSEINYFACCAKDNDRHRCCAATEGGKTREEAANAWNRRATDWIPVTEGLPETHDFVLVTTKHKSGKETWFTIRTGCYDSKYGWSTGGSKNVVAWMPLPDPYEG